MNKSIILKILFSIALLAFLATLVEWDEVVRLLPEIHVLWWAPAIALMLGQMVVLAWRWYILINGKRPTISYSTALRMTLAGNIANLVVVASIGGLVARIALAVHHGLSLTRASTAAIVDRLITLATLCALAAMLFPFFPFDSAYDLTLPLQVLIAGFVLVIAVLPIGLKYLQRALVNSALIRDVIDYFHDILSSPLRVFQIALSSLIAQTLYMVAIVMVTYTVSPDIPFYKLVALLPMIILVSSLPISFGGWGVREGSFIFGLALIGIPHEVALLISVQIGFLTMISAIIVGLPAIFHPDVSSIIQPHKAPAE